MRGNILTFEKYGKLPFYKGLAIALKNRFRINPYAELLLIERGLKPYIPKLNKMRVALSVVGVAFCVVIPFITPLSILVLLWGLK